MLAQKPRQLVADIGKHMKILTSILVGLAATASLTACGTDDVLVTAGPTGDAIADGDAAVLDENTAEIFDIAVAETGIDAGIDATVGPELPDSILVAELPSIDVGPACPGEVGCACESDAGCPAASACLENENGKICAAPCTSDQPCVAGYTCAALPGDPSTTDDDKAVCVSKFPTSCDPCKTSATCTSLGNPQAVCAGSVPPAGLSGWFCSNACKNTNDCPSGNDCVPGSTVDGALGNFCRPYSGACVCSESAKTKQLSTTCAATGKLPDGTPIVGCVGVRICDKDGLSPCSAPVPSAEICDGVDNDCNGVTDDAAKGLQFCDDFQICTDDACKGATCTHTPNAIACDDGTACTEKDVCKTNACGGTPIVCDDKNVCTSDSCDAKLGCQNVPNNLVCDDGDPCTGADNCVAAKCMSGDNICACAADSDCASKEDGNACNGKLFCSKVKAPFVCKVNPATVIQCDPAGDSVCAMSTCNPIDGKCTPVGQNKGVACDDGSVCTVGETCAGALCQAGVASNCDDGNACTDDSCDDKLGCAHKANAAQCNDANGCTMGDACADSTCKGVVNDCDDKNLCTTDACDPLVGCKYTANKEVCDDGDACTGGDVCTNGKCTGAVNSCPCKVNNGGCGVNASCAAGANGLPVCTPCLAGFQLVGSVCADIDECKIPNSCAAEATCANTAGAFTCTCNKGYTGNGKTCADIDECSIKPLDCAPTATCVNTKGSYTCVCPIGVGGDGKTCGKKGGSADTAAASCLEIYTLDPKSADGAYWLDIDGAGPIAAAQYQCDMKNGGWTLVIADNFESDSPASWSAGKVSACGKFGKILGGADQFGAGATTTKTVGAPVHTTAKLTMNYIRIDTWDNEHGFVKVDGVQVWTAKGFYLSFSSGTWECGGKYITDESWDVAWTGAHSAKTIAVTATSDLNEAADNESFGIDNVVVWVK